MAVSINLGGGDALFASVFEIRALLFGVYIGLLLFGKSHMACFRNWGFAIKAWEI